MNNERGGISSKLLIIPAGAALLLGSFFLGLYLGKNQDKAGEPGGNMPPLPEIVAGNQPKTEEFTFYKTLTEKDSKTISIELKPRSAATESAPATRQTAVAEDAVPGAPGVNSAEIRGTDKTPDPGQAGVNVAGKTPREDKAGQTRQAASSKKRYTVQVSSHQEKRAADQELKRMKRNGFAAFIVSAAVPGMGTRHRVRLGSFTNKAAAEKLRKEVRAKLGIPAMVVPE